MDIPLLMPKTTKSNAGPPFMIEPISNLYRPGDHPPSSDPYSEKSVLSKASKAEAKWTHPRTYW
jgi:hypothetical protein